MSKTNRKSPAREGEPAGTEMFTKATVATVQHVTQPAILHSSVL